MATTTVKFPGSAETISETGHSGYTWVNPTYITADDTNYAAITTNFFDTGVTSFVLKAYNFDTAWASVPVGAVIDGVIVTIRAWYTDGGVNLDLVQLLDVSRAKVGTNLAATPTALTSSEATYTFGASDNLWGNLLTDTWVHDVDFGVAIGAISTGTNSEVRIDWVKMEIYYHLNVTAMAGKGGVTAGTQTPTIVLTNPASITANASKIDASSVLRVPTIKGDSLVALNCLITAAVQRTVTIVTTVSETVIQNSLTTTVALRALTINATENTSVAVVIETLTANLPPPTIVLENPAIAVTAYPACLSTTVVQKGGSLSATLINTTGGLWDEWTDPVTTPAIDTTGANFIAIGLHVWSAYTTAGSITDNKGNTYQSLTKYDWNAGTTEWVQIWYCKNPTVGTGHTFSINGSKYYKTITVAAFNVPVDVFEEENGNWSNGSLTIQPGSVSPDAANSFIVTLWSDGNDDNSPKTIDNDFIIAVQQYDGVTMGGSLAYKLQPIAGAINPTWTHPSITGPHTASIAVFTTTGGGLNVSGSAVVEVASPQLTTAVPRSSSAIGSAVATVGVGLAYLSVKEKTVFAGAQVSLNLLAVTAAPLVPTVLAGAQVVADIQSTQIIQPLPTITTSGGISETAQVSCKTVTAWASGNYPRLEAKFGLGVPLIRDGTSRYALGTVYGWFEEEPASTVTVVTEVITAVSCLTLSSILKTPTVETAGTTICEVALVEGCVVQKSPTIEVTANIVQEVSLQVVYLSAADNPETILWTVLEVPIQTGAFVQKAATASGACLVPSALQVGTLVQRTPTISTTQAEGVTVSVAVVSGNFVQKVPTIVGTESVTATAALVSGNFVVKTSTINVAFDVTAIASLVSVFVIIGTPYVDIGGNALATPTIGIGSIVQKTPTIVVTANIIQGVSVGLVKTNQLTPTLFCSGLVTTGLQAGAFIVKVPTITGTSISITGVQTGGFVTKSPTITSACIVSVPVLIATLGVKIPTVSLLVNVIASASSGIVYTVPASPYIGIGGNALATPNIVSGNLVTKVPTITVTAHISQPVSVQIITIGTKSSIEIGGSLNSVSLSGIKVGQKVPGIIGGATIQSGLIIGSLVLRVPVIYGSCNAVSNAAVVSAVQKPIGVSGSAVVGQTCKLITTTQKTPIIAGSCLFSVAVTQANIVQRTLAISGGCLAVGSLRTVYITQRAPTVVTSNSVSPIASVGRVCVLQKSSTVTITGEIVQPAGPGIVYVGQKAPVIIAGARALSSVVAVGLVTKTPEVKATAQVQPSVLLCTTVKKSPTIFGSCVTVCGTVGVNATQRPAAGTVSISANPACGLVTTAQRALTVYASAVILPVVKSVAVSSIAPSLVLIALIVYGKVFKVEPRERIPLCAERDWSFILEPKSRIFEVIH